MNVSPNWILLPAAVGIVGGAAMCLAGILGLISGQMSVPNRAGGVTGPIRGLAARLIGLAFAALGLFILRLGVDLVRSTLAA